MEARCFSTRKQLLEVKLQAGVDRRAQNQSCRDRFFRQAQNVMEVVPQAASLVRVDRRERDVTPTVLRFSRTGASAANIGISTSFSVVLQLVDQLACLL